LDAEGSVLVDTSAVKPEMMIREFKGESKKKSQGGIIPWLTFRGQKFFRAQDL
jgi:hypothetical protein